MAHSEGKRVPAENARRRRCGKRAAATEHNVLPHLRDHFVDVLSDREAIWEWLFLDLVDVSETCFKYYSGDVSREFLEYFIASNEISLTQQLSIRKTQKTTLPQEQPFSPPQQRQ